MNLERIIDVAIVVDIALIVCTIVYAAYAYRRLKQEERHDQGR